MEHWSCREALGEDSTWSSSPIRLESCTLREQSRYREEGHADFECRCGEHGSAVTDHPYIRTRSRHIDANTANSFSQPFSFSFSLVTGSWSSNQREPHTCSYGYRAECSLATDAISLTRTTILLTRSINREVPLPTTYTLSANHFPSTPNANSEVLHFSIAYPAHERLHLESSTFLLAAGTSSPHKHSLPFVVASTGEAEGLHVL